MSLLAYHLPLDAHGEFGNNVQLGRRLGLIETGDLGRQNNHPLGLVGRLEVAMSAADFAALIGARLGREPLCIEADDGAALIQTVAWCTGAAQGFIERAVDAGVDAYLSGEISEPTVHIARESGVHYFGAGHHATERYGVQALAEHLQSLFDIEHEFIDIDNPV